MLIGEWLSLHGAMLLWGEAMEGKPNSFSYLFEASNLIFFLQCCTGTTLPVSWTSIKAILSLGDWLNLCSSGFLAHGWEGLEPFRGHNWDQGLCAYYLRHRWMRRFLSSMAIVLVIELKPKGVMAKSSRVQHYFWAYSWDHSLWVSYLGVGCLMAFLSLGLHQDFTIPCLDPKAPTNHFCPWMSPKLLLLKGKYERWTSYLAILLTS